MNQAKEVKTLIGPILALDLGEKRVGVAVSDELQISIKRLPPLLRSSWKQLLSDVMDFVKHFKATALVIGFPLGPAGVQGEAAGNARRSAEKFARSLSIPIYLQDERLTSVAAREQLLAEGHNPKELKRLLDSEAAAIILGDFIGGGQDRILVSAAETD
jgi:putative Holliday junction resolvase